MRRKEAGFIAAQAAIFVAVIALVSLPIQSTNEPQVSSSSARARSLTFTSGVSPQGLQLRVILNSSSIQSYGAISGRVEVFNKLNRNVSLSGLVQNQNISDWNGDDYLCANGASSIVGFALFRGHFAAGNISAAGQPLQLAPPEVIYCASSSPPTAVTFLPEGDQAVATDDFQKSYPVTVSVNATTGYANPGLVGYWNDSIPTQSDFGFTSPAFVYFPPGEYTIVATDLWSQFVYTTFVVEPSPQPDGLQVNLILNSTSIQTGGAITAQIEVLNTLDHNVTLASGPTWNQTIPALKGTMYSLNAYDYVCSDNPDYYFANFLLFKGHYSAGNISSAGSPLQEGPPVYPPCAGPANTPFPVTFLPNGDEVAVSQPGYIPLNLTAEVSANTLYCAGSGGNGGGFSCRYGQGLVGYWNSSASAVDGNLGFMSPGFTYFPPGEYTVVAFDAWNQYVYATFVVEP